MGPAAVLAVLTTVQMFLDNSLVKRMLQNIANKTTNKIDDAVLEILYTASTMSSPVIETQSKLDKAQEKYDSLTETEKKIAKESPSVVAKSIPDNFFGQGG